MSYSCDRASYRHIQIKKIKTEHFGFFCTKTKLNKLSYICFISQIHYYYLCKYLRVYKYQPGSMAKLNYNVNNSFLTNGSCHSQTISQIIYPYKNHLLKLSGKMFQVSFFKKILNIKEKEFSLKLI